MHRAQVLLQDDLYERLKVRARNQGLSTSKLIRDLLEQGIDRPRAADARAFFDRLMPLDSFAGIEASDYVRELRNTSRLLGANGDDA